MLHMLDADMLDGTPVLDLKPYVAYTDAHPGAGKGWLDGQKAGRCRPPPADPLPAFTVRFEPQALEQAAMDREPRASATRTAHPSTLALGPAPHPYRRIRRHAQGLQLAVKEWRVRLHRDGSGVCVFGVDSGFRPAQLAAGVRPGDSRGAHGEFLARWPRRPC